MTSKEFSELEYKAHDITNKIADEFKKRIKELYVIAKEKGLYPAFGWLEGEMEEPDYDDFETEEEGDEAYEKYEEFCDARISFIWSDDHNFTIFDGYSFEIDEDGNVTFTSVMAIEDAEDKEFFEDTHYGFYPHLADNWRACGRIIEQIERELGIE
jgi:hypothetical protein